MGFFKRAKNQNLDLLSGYSWHVPGVGGMFGMLVWLIVGAVLGNFCELAFMAAFGAESAMTWGMLIAYVVMFLPPMIASKRISLGNSMFDTGYKLNSCHFGKPGFPLLALLCILATVASAYALDVVNALMPPMPARLEEIMGSLTGDENLFASVLSVSIFAPFFEEWLCRGTILRGLLNCSRRKKTSSAHVPGSEDASTYVQGDAPAGASSPSRGFSPAVAICISALFFAVIHLNPWQAIPAFALGCLFGWVYYKTGSIWLTMLMHCANNTMALLLGQVDAWADADTFLDILPLWGYCIGFVIALGLVWLLLRALKEVPLSSPQGNCDHVNMADIG